MTAAAGSAFGSLEQFGAVTRMWTMAVGATVGCTANHVIMGALQGPAYLFMALQTIFLAEFAFGMTDCATLRIRLM